MHELAELMQRAALFLREAHINQLQVIIIKELLMSIDTATHLW